MKMLLQCRLSCLCALVLTIAVWPARVSSQTSAGQQQPEPAAVKASQLSFSVVDASGLFVTTLRGDDVRVWEDGQPQEILNFQRRVEQPLSFVLMLDTSVSQEKAIPNAKRAARDFVTSIMRPGKDAACIITFTGEATLENQLTSDRERALRAIDSIKFEPPPGYYVGGIVLGPVPTKSDMMRTGSTAIWDALWVAADEVLARAPSETRRAIIVLTDGVDTSSRKKLNEAIERAIKAQVVVFTIGIGDTSRGGIEAAPLRKVAERTGGRLFLPKTFDDLPSVLVEIEQELRSQYSVSYLSTSKKGGGKMRKIKIEIVNPEMRKRKLQLSHAQGYFPED
jgi:VWFA-related protein